MRLAQSDIDFAERQAKMLYATDIDARIEVLKWEFVTMSEQLTVVAGVSVGVKFLRELADACEEHSEHGDMLFEAFKGFVELQEIKDVKEV